MSTKPRIYLDNAATSWPKPPAVYEAVCRYMRENGAAAGRGVYGSSQQVAAVLSSLRRRLALLLGISSTSRVIFTFNGTDALNLAIHGLLGPGDHVVTTDVEHNSVLRPLRFLQRYRGVTVTYVPCDSSGTVAPDDVAAALRPETRLVALTHASNVTGAIQPVEDILAALGDHPAFRLIDAAQTAGHLPLQAESLGVDLLACSGHKGLLGPLGTGVLAISQRAAETLVPLREGGTGTFSEQEDQPQKLPDRFESGNLNVPGLVGLERGVAFLEERSLEAMRCHEKSLVAYLLESLNSVRGCTVIGPQDAERQVGVVSFRLEGYDPQELAAILDAEFGIEVRSGLHCAPRLHHRLGTLHSGGTVRVSVGPFTVREHIDSVAAALHQLAAV